MLYSKKQNGIIFTSLLICYVFKLLLWLILFSLLKVVNQFNETSVSHPALQLDASNFKIVLQKRRRYIERITGEVCVCVWGGGGGGG